MRRARSVLVVTDSPSCEGFFADKLAPATRVRRRAHDSRAQHVPPGIDGVIVDLTTLSPVDAHRAMVRAQEQSAGKPVVLYLEATPDLLRSVYLPWHWWAGKSVVGAVVLSGGAQRSE